MSAALPPRSTGRGPAPSPQDSAPERDPGLQPERTQLAWQRTAIGVMLSCAVLSLTVVRQDRAYLAIVAGLVGGLAGWWALVHASRRRVAVQHPPWGPLVLAACAVGALGILGALAALEQVTR